MEHLSTEQTIALERFKAGKNLFITGPGGTGKTRLIHYLVQYARSVSHACQVCAMTGCAAILIGGGAKTLHSWSGMRLGRGTKADIIKSIRGNPRAVKNWKQVKVLILDEVSMLSKKIFEAIEEAARIIRKNGARFGGIQVIFTGDFFQLPPVGSALEPDTMSFCFESPIWNSVFEIRNHIELTTVFRQTDPIYKSILMEIRRGSITEANAEILRKYVGREKPTECVPTKLFAHSSKAEFVNKAKFEKLEEKIYYLEYEKNTKMTVDYHSKKDIPKDILSKCASLTVAEIDYELENLINNTSCLPVLSLKKGSVIMCTVNYDMERGICNGMQGIVTNIVEISNKIKKLDSKETDITPATKRYAPVVQFVNGYTTTMELHYWQSDEYPTIAVGQYPICLAWALTIHKIQGATLKMAEMDIGKTIFEYGQTYVALSRIESLDGLYLSAFQPERIKANERVTTFYERIAEAQRSLPEEEITADSQELKEEEIAEPSIVPSIVPSTTRKIIL